MGGRANRYFVYRNMLNTGKCTALHSSIEVLAVDKAMVSRGLLGEVREWGRGERGLRAGRGERGRGPQGGGLSFYHNML